MGKSASGRSSNRAGSRESGGGGIGGIGGGGGGVGRREKRDRERSERRRRRSGNGSGAGPRFSVLDQQRQEREAAAVMGRDTGVGAEAPWMKEDEEERGTTTSSQQPPPPPPPHTAAAGSNTSGLRIPLSMISNVGAKTNVLSPFSSHQQYQQPPSLLPPLPPSPSSHTYSSPSSLSSSPSKKKKHPRTHLHPISAADPTNNPGGMYGLGSSALGDDDRIFFVPEGRARRPVSVESSPTRFTSVRGGIVRENATGGVSSPPPPPIPRKSDERGTGTGTKTRESSVAGNEAFL